MYKYSFQFVVLLVVTMFLTACPKNEPVPQSTIAGKLINNWKVTKVTQVGSATPLYQNPLPAGQSNREDYSYVRLSITSNTEYLMYERSNSVRTGAWELASNDTKIILDKGVEGKEAILEIVEIQEGSLKVRFIENSTKTGSRELQMDFVPF